MPSSLLKGNCHLPHVINDLEDGMLKWSKPGMEEKYCKISFIGKINNKNTKVK
jgi:hypothetical protein